MSGHSWQQHVEHVRAKGFLAKPRYVILTEPVAGADTLAAHLPQHLAYQKDLEARGVTFAAGPFADDAERAWRGEGMIIVRADSLAAAHAIAEADPMHLAGVRRFRVRPAAQRGLVHRDRAPFRTVPQRHLTDRP